MVNEKIEKRAHELVKIAKEKGLITKYSDFCKSELAEETKLNKDEIAYTISLKNKEELK